MPETLNPQDLNINVYRGMGLTNKYQYYALGLHTRITLTV